MLPKLSSVTVVGAKKLTDISSLTGIGSRLKHLDLSSCKQLGNVESLAPLTKLRTLGLGNCGSIASFKPLAHMTDLAALEAYESTRVEDGDLTPLLGLAKLRRLGMMQRKTYRPTVQEVKDHLGIRG